jgi:two-component system, cell cycle sensor histidine kinase and response regulator CckA
MRYELKKEDPLSQKVDQIAKCSERAAGLTRQLLAFSRKQVLEPKVLNLNQVVSDVEKMLCRLIGEHIELSTALSPDLGRVKADPGQIEQVIVNLAVNSRDAMPDGGKLTIETSNVVLDENYAAQHVASVPGAYVMIAVTDTGCGMDETTETRIFEPFFTTKEKGKGTGMGLATVYGIVKQSGGNIWCYSELGKGTTFKVYLPQVADMGASPLVPQREGAKTVSGTETILIAEDEETILEIASEMLTIAGYSVIPAMNGGEALLACRNFKGEIHLLITDVIMPHMSGKQLVQSLLELRPGLKILYTSGYTDDSIVHHGFLEEGTPFLQKPFNMEALTRKVREVLDKK